MRERFGYFYSAIFVHLVIYSRLSPQNRSCISFKRKMVSRHIAVVILQNWSCTINERCCNIVVKLLRMGQRKPECKSSAYSRLHPTTKKWFLISAYCTSSVLPSTLSADIYSSLLIQKVIWWLCPLA